VPNRKRATYLCDVLLRYPLLLLLLLLLLYIYYVVISPYPELIPNVVGHNLLFRWKEGSVHVPN
jgi:hypothetical protein